MSWSMLIAKPRRLRATMSKFAKCQTQANCQECPAVAAHLCDGRGKDSNPTKEFCRSNSHVPNRKLKPPQMRRFEFSGRQQVIIYTSVLYLHTNATPPFPILVRISYMNQKFLFEWSHLNKVFQ